MHHIDACACTQQYLTWGKQQALSIPDLAASRGLRASFFIFFRRIRRTISWFLFRRFFFMGRSMRV